MTSEATVHVIDRNVERRNSIAWQLLSHGMAAQKYPSVCQLPSRLGGADLILAFDEERCFGGSDALASILYLAERAPVVLYATEPDPARIVMTLLAGVLDYLAWPFEYERLKQPLDRLARVNAATAAGRTEETEAQVPVGTLTAQERDVLQAVVEGASNKDMARTLGITPAAVEICRASMMRKLAASSTASAVRIGVLAGVGA